MHRHCPVEANNLSLLGFPGLEDFSHCQTVRGQALQSWENPLAVTIPQAIPVAAEVSKTGPLESNRPSPPRRPLLSRLLGVPLPASCSVSLGPAHASPFTASCSSNCALLSQTQPC